MNASQTSLALALFCMLGAGCGDDDAEPFDGGSSVDASTTADVGVDASTEDAAMDVGDPDAVVAMDGSMPDGGDAGQQDPGVVLPAVDVELVAGSSEPIRFTVPPETVSVGITVVGEALKSYWICAWTGPDGEEFVRPGWHEDLLQPWMTTCSECANRVSMQEEVTTALLPNSSGIVPPSGEHTVQICGRTIEDGSALDEVVELSVIGRTGDEPTTGVLDLNLYFSGARWTASSAAMDPEFAAVLDGVEALLANARMSLGNLTYNDVDESLQTIAFEELADLFSVVDPATPFAVNVMFVDEITSDFGGTISGVSGGLPGAFSISTRKSGVAIAITGSDEQLSGVIAHEVGHYLGLSHTSELVVMFGEDQFDDTPSEDPAYLMSPSIGTLISDEQARILLRSPYVRP